MNSLQGAIHDHGKDDPLEFDLTGWSPVVHGIRSAINERRYLQQLHDWTALADVRHTPEQLDAIRADQAARIKAMGNK